MGKHAKKWISAWRTFDFGNARFESGRPIRAKHRKDAAVLVDMSILDEYREREGKLRRLIRDNPQA